MMQKIRATFCVWFGHSRFVTTCFGYQYCGRCGTQVGDALGGIGAPDILSLRHIRQGKPCCDPKRVRWHDRWLLNRATIEDAKITVQQEHKFREEWEVYRQGWRT